MQTKDTREGKIGHSAAARETGSTASAKHSGHSVGKTTHCCQWQSLSITCCSIFDANEHGPPQLFLHCCAYGRG